ncbi:hypothetical protein ACIBF1_03620 [Spirillospora sp. NPDC050679]
MKTTAVDVLDPAPLRRQAMRELERRYPGVLAWWGNATGSYWAFVPIRGGLLLEGAHPEQLGGAIARIWWGGTW